MSQLPTYVKSHAVTSQLHSCAARPPGLPSTGAYDEVNIFSKDVKNDVYDTYHVIVQSYPLESIKNGSVSFQLKCQSLSCT